MADAGALALLLVFAGLVGDACDWLFVGGAVLVCACAGEFDGCADWACDGDVAALLPDCACDGGEAGFDWACERDESLPVVFGADWLVVVGDLSEGVDGVFWADVAELGEVAVEDAGADEFELV